MCGGNLQGNVADQLLEFFASDSALLARSDFDQHTEFRPGMDIRRH